MSDVMAWIVASAVVGACAGLCTSAIRFHDDCLVSTVATHDVDAGGVPLQYKVTTCVGKPERAVGNELVSY